MFHPTIISMPTDAFPIVIHPADVYHARIIFIVGIRMWLCFNIDNLIVGSSCTNDDDAAKLEVCHKP